MASVAMMIGGAVVNALAFTGGNYLFSKLGHADAHEEMRRHDEAVERLQAAQAEWMRKRTARLDWLNDELQREGHAVHSFQDVDQAMREYSLISGKRVEPLEPEPRLSDFYVPSEPQKDREITFIVLGLAATGIVAYKLL